jgi:hypothetical protein
MHRGDLVTERLEVGGQQAAELPVIVDDQKSS